MGMTLATIILAAGQSARLGQPKQLLLHNGQPLVRRMADAALALAAGPVVVVTGANAAQVGEAIADLPVQVRFNADYQHGMASSLHTGLTSLPSLPDAVLILLTDQPYVDLPLLQTIWATAQRTQRGIIACRYGDVLGVPVLFRARYVPDLLALSGDSGARKLVQQHHADCAEVPFDQGAIDLDTPEDVARWQRG
jgi:molybdenum cofactor cytidylyltransferase